MYPGVFSVLNTEREIEKLRKVELKTGEDRRENRTKEGRKKACDRQRVKEKIEMVFCKYYG